MSSSDPSSRVSILTALLEQHRNEHHIISIGNPDPDSISCAMAHQMIAAEYGISCTIIYDGKLSHQENVTMVNLLDIDLVQYNDKLNFNNHSHFVLVDNQASGSPSLIAKFKEHKINPICIVDHHDKQHIVEAEYTHIERVEAAATLYIEYFKQGILDFANHPDAKKVATALMLALRTETNGLTRARKREFESAAFIAPFVDNDLLNDIMSIKRSSHVMDIFKKSLESRKIEHGYSISGVGYLSAQNRDSIPIAADLLLTEENVHTSIVYGIVIKDNGSECISGSLRTSNLTINADAFIKNCFGRDSNGNFYGGAKMGAGGFEIPVGFLAGCLTGNIDSDFMKKKNEIYQMKIEECILKAIGAYLVSNGNKDS